MTSPYSDTPDPSTGFDPDRHRKEIELMEQRFRERSDRHGGGPATTGEIDGRVADEMREFFDASEQQLKTVVPRLQVGDQSTSMAETTDEIRKKINDFFAQVKDGGSSAAQKAPPAQRLAKRKARWTGTLPPPREEGRSAPRGAPAAFAPPSSHLDRRDAPAPRAHARTPSSDAEKMDLKTALEKLRRHGGERVDDRAASGPTTTTTAPDVTPPRMATAPAAPRREPPAPPSSRREQPAVAPPREPARFAPTRREPPPAAAPRPAPRQAAAAPSPPPPPPVVAERRPPRAAPAPAPEPAPPQADPRDGFDSIFKEVEGIVLDTLKSKADEPSAAPRAAEPEEPPTLREQAPISEPVSQLVSLRTDDSDDVDVDTPPPASARAPQFARPEEDAEEEPDEAAPAPYDWGVKPAGAPKGAWLLDVPDPPAAEPEPPSPKGAQRAPSPAPAEADGSSSMRGARNFLVRKTSDEVQRFQPVLKALKDAAILDDKDIDGDAKAAPDGEEGFLSADSFNDDVPRGADVEAELSPMRLVEELRRIKRITQALMAKGVISLKDLEKTDGD